ncbi:MAG: hypothetical protein Q4Q53_06630 [Methanocorpusculum sp.]|nr:hypothetical protein [Methanocorpusculum sp.]
MKLIIFTAVILLIIFSAGCISNSDPIFTIADKTTVYSADDSAINLSALNIPQGVTKYQLVTFDNPIPDRSDKIFLECTLFGKNDTVTLDRMKYALTDEDIDSYAFSTEVTRFTLTVDDMGCFRAVISAEGKTVCIGSIGKNGATLNGKPLYIVYVEEEQPKPFTFSFCEIIYYIFPSPETYIEIQNVGEDTNDSEIVYLTDEDLKRHSVFCKSLKDGKN